MPRYPTFPDLFDEVKQVSMSGLKQLGYLRSNATVSGSYRWTRGGEHSGSIGVKVSLADRFVELDYLVNGTPINYRIQIEGIPTHFGSGYNWYFICPQTGKRCRKLYLIGPRFLHRDAFKGAMYSCQTRSKSWRDFVSVFRFLDADQPFNRKYAKKYYRGKPTKRYWRLLERCQRTEGSIDRLRQAGLGSET